MTSDFPRLFSTQYDLHAATYQDIHLKATLELEQTTSAEEHTFTLAPEKKDLPRWLVTTSLRLPLAAPTQSEPELVDRASGVTVEKADGQAESG